MLAGQDLTVSCCLALIQKLNISLIVVAKVDKSSKKLFSKAWNKKDDG